MNTSLNISILLILTFFSSGLMAQVTFSEVMFDVSTNEYHDEYVEIFNRSYTDTLDLSGWIFSDSSGLDILSSVKGDNKLLPRSFGLILDGSYFFNSTTYDSIIPDSINIFSISDNSLGSNGLSNTFPETLFLYDSAGQLLTSYRYSIGNIPGFSDEKIDLDGSNVNTNWADSKIPGGTPGWKNSVSPLQYDPGFNGQSLIIPEVIFNNVVTEITVVIFNFGQSLPTDSLEIEMFSDMNRNQRYDSNEPFIGRDIIPVSTQMIGFKWEGMNTGDHYLTACLICPSDENNRNNLIQKIIQVHNGHAQLHINEIKFLTKETEPEWIELINSGSEEIYLKGWSIADRSDTVCIETPIFIQSDSFFVISSDTLRDNNPLLHKNYLILKTLPVLNDQDDNIRLLNALTIIEEEISYSREWLEGEDYRLPSLEKINPSLHSNLPQNWGPSVDPSGSTPGKKNSIYANLKVKSHSLEVNPNPFSPDADGIEDVTVISGTIPENSARICVQIYDIKGRLIKTLSDNTFTGHHFYFVWDGRDNQGRIARIGIYIIFIQAINDQKGLLMEMKTTLVLAQKL